MKKLLLVTVLVFYTQTVWAGWVVTYKDSETGDLSNAYYEKNKANFGDMIVDGNRIVAVDHAAQAYWEGTSQQYCTAMKAWTNKLQSQMAAMPPAYRPKPINERKVSRKKVGKENVAGFTATGYDFYIDGNQEERIWVTSDSDFSGILDVEESMTEKMKCLDDLVSMSLIDAELYKSTVEGKFIVKESDRQVVSLKKTGVSPSKFQGPDGYRRFSDHNAFIEHSNNHSEDSSYSSSESSAREEYEEQVQEDARRPKDDNIIVKDAKDIGEGAAKDAHDSTKRGIERGVSEKVDKGVNKLLKKFGF